MKSRFSSLFEVARQLVVNNSGVQLAVKESRGVSLAPITDLIIKSGKREYVIKYNPRMEVILALYDIHVLHGIDCSNALIHFLLFHASLQKDKYDRAQQHLDALRQELRSLAPQSKIDDIKGILSMQVMYILMHEALHVCYANSANDRNIELVQSKNVLNGLRAEYEEDFGDIKCREDVLKNKHMMTVLQSYIPDGMEGDERQKMLDKLVETALHDMNYVSCIDQILANNDEDYMEELACDRYAWINMITAEKNQGADSEYLFIMNVVMYAAFNAINFTKGLQYVYYPSEHAKKEYDAQRIAIRQRAFMNLYRECVEDNGCFDYDFYNEITVRVQNLGPVVMNSINTQEEDIYDLYLNKSDDSESIDFGAINKLESELDEIASMIL